MRARRKTQGRTRRKTRCETRPKTRPKTRRKTLLRVAICIHRRLTGGENQPPPVELPRDIWCAADRLARLIGLARQHGWQLAQVRLRRQLASHLDMLRRVTGELGERLTAATPERRDVALPDIYRELVALHEEFSTVSWSIPDKALSVITEPVELEGVHLGPFEIRLNWDHLDGSPSYRLIAKEPAPAATDSSVTHPHVQDEQLCEGEARTAIRQALVQVRLCDFFLIVAAALRTYNPNSPFVPLDRWCGVICAHCGDNSDEEDMCSCDACNVRVCADCLVECVCCRDSSCFDCTCKCGCCNDDFCQACLTRCSACRAVVCRSCISLNQTCKACHDDNTGSKQETRQETQHKTEHARQSQS